MRFSPVIFSRLSSRSLLRGVSATQSGLFTEGLSLEERVPNRLRKRGRTNAMPLKYEIHSPIWQRWPSGIGAGLSRLKQPSYTHPSTSPASTSFEREGWIRNITWVARIRAVLPIYRR